jgi:hypothetical protein
MAPSITIGAVILLWRKPAMEVMVFHSPLRKANQFVRLAHLNGLGNPLDSDSVESTVGIRGALGEFVPATS